MRIIGRILLALVTLVVLVVVLVYVSSEAMIRKSYTAPEVAITVPTDSASLARGQHLMTSVCTCTDCHRPDLSGSVMFDQQPLGRVVAPNITRGKGGTTLTDAEIARVIRYGVRPTGRSVIVMPSADFAHLSDADLGCVIAYLRSLPPADSVRKGIALGPLARALIVANKMPIIEAPKVDRNAVAAAAPPEGVTPAYGHYLANNAGCTSCHTGTLAGGVIADGAPDWPPAANITTKGIIADWGFVDFTDMMRTGRDKHGHVVHEAMPYRAYRTMTDDELAAIWAFLQDAPPVDPSAHPIAKR